ncbi:MAG: lysophospholipid acyltransferase family protein [Burkholderiaceae bacterium]
MLTIVIRFPRLGPQQRQQCVQVWSLQMLSCLGIRLQVRGQPALPGPLLLASNHISWLDITALHAARFCRFVSKADIKRWPLIGFLAAGNGTLFIERESRRDAKRMVLQMAQSLREGDVLAVFPEGTTGDGCKLLPFHANLLQAAIEAEAPIQPVALRFEDLRTGEISSAPLYIGNESLLSSVWRTLCAPTIVVVVCFGEVQFADGRDRRAWSADLRHIIDALRQAQPSP